MCPSVLGESLPGSVWGTSGGSTLSPDGLSSSHSYTTSLTNWRRGSFICKSPAGAVRPCRSAHRELGLLPGAVDPQPAGSHSSKSHQLLLGMRFPCETLPWFLIPSSIQFRVEQEKSSLLSAFPAEHSAKILLTSFYSQHWSYCLIEAIVLFRRKCPMSETWETLENFN